MTSLFDKLRLERNAKRRRADVASLWPIMRAYYPKLDQAKTAFVEHAREMPAWVELGDAGIIAEIASLE